MKSRLVRDTLLQSGPLCAPLWQLQFSVSSVSMLLQFVHALETLAMGKPRRSHQQ
jgi:hypothetical protein